MEIILNHHLESVDFQTNTGVFLYCTNKCKEWIKVNVPVDPVLIYRITHRNAKDKLPMNIPYIGRTFSAPYKGGTYEDSPFKLVHFQPDNGSDIPEGFKLEPVDKGYSEEVVDALLKKVVGYKNFWREPSQYVRFEVHKVSKMLKDLKPSVNIIAPNVEYVPFGPSI